MIPRLRALRTQFEDISRFLKLPAEAKKEHLRDLRRLPEGESQIEHAIHSAVEWIRNAQDHSASGDGGVAAYFSLETGWAESYPETTGYIVPTLLEYSRWTGDAEWRDRVRKMLDWLRSIQFENGGFPGGTIRAQPRVPVTFNTGQILFGLAIGSRELGNGYASSAKAAADWLVETQDADGCWRAFPSPFTSPGERVYETHVAWALLEAERAIPGWGYAESALRNVRWALSKQHQNGWFDDCCLNDPTQPLTHTIGYALRGCLEAYIHSGDQEFLDASKRTADGLLSAIRKNGSLPGRLSSDWRGEVPWDCLTGSVQIAHCLFLLFDHTRDSRYLSAGRDLNGFVRKTLNMTGPVGIRGGVKGSFPVSGGYCPYWFINWGTKFLIDSHLKELDYVADSTPDFKP